MSLINEWNAMTEAEQYNMMERCIYSAAKVRRARVVDASEYIGGTWERVISTIESAEDSLVNVVFRAASACIQQELRAVQKRDACVAEVSYPDGEAVSIYDVIVSERDGTERQAILRVDMERFLSTRDSTDLAILEHRICGYTEREIAAILETLSHVAIHKRLVKMRDALRESVA